MLGLLLPDGRLISRNMYGIMGVCGRIMMVFSGLSWAHTSASGKVVLQGILSAGSALLDGTEMGSYSTLAFTGISRERCFGFQDLDGLVLWHSDCKWTMGVISQ
jgi:hypothetical protein